jgi:hypothetical protein
LIAVWNGSVAPRDPLAYAVTAGTNWLTVSPASGAVVDETNTLALTFLSEGLAPGYYTAQVSVAIASSRPSGGGDPAGRPVPGLEWDALGKVWTNEISEGSRWRGDARGVEQERSAVGGDAVAGVRTTCRGLRSPPRAG